MGITGLLPFLEKKTARKVSLEEFSGGTAAVDTYCWLHKGIFSCADRLSMGIQTDGYVTYCMNYVNLLLNHKIKPILVFDGRHLPAKAETELKRRELREARRKRASELMKMGEVQEGRKLLKRAIDVSHEMALDVMRKCQEINVDCIVAPYEADAELAYLNTSGIADFVITEDSDLTLFGCTKILFKMDKFGNGTLVEQDRIYLSMGIRKEDFDIEKFRHMCILSGCDYLPSLPGVGLAKALKFAQKNTDEDIYKALGRLNSFINKKLIITHEYREAFIRALMTFKHQLVYCPLKRKQVRLNPEPPDITPEQLHHAGDPVDEELAYQLALGNCHPFGFKKLNDFDPDKRSSLRLKRTNGWHENPSLEYPSIWSESFKIKTPSIEAASTEITKWPNTAGRQILMSTKVIKEKISPSKKVESNVSVPSHLKRSSEFLDDDLEDENLIKLYGNSKIPKTEENAQEKANEQERYSSPTTSPKRFNPFLKKPALCETSPSLVPRGRRRMKYTLIAFEPTIVDENVVTQSRFFSSAGPSTKDSAKTVIIPETQDADLEAEGMHLEKTTVPIINSDKSVPTHVIIPETQDEEVEDNAGLIIPESPDELPLSQNSSKENDDSNILTKTLENEKCLQRSDSGVDMKEDTTSNNANEFFNEIEDNCSAVKKSPGLDITIKKYALTNSKEVSPRVPNPDGFEDFIGSVEPIDNIRNTFFKWSNPKTEKSRNFLKNQSSISSQPSIKRNASQSSIARSKRPSVSKKLPHIDSQQSLLNMFGFKKK